MLSNRQVMHFIGDYDIVVDDPKKHIPYAMFCSTVDAMIFMESLKESNPEVDWQTMKLEDWQREYYAT